GSKPDRADLRQPVSRARHRVGVGLDARRRRQRLGTAAPCREPPPRRARLPSPRPDRGALPARRDSGPAGDGRGDRARPHPAARPARQGRQPRRGRRGRRVRPGQPGDVRGGVAGRRRRAGRGRRGARRRGPQRLRTPPAARTPRDPRAGDGLLLLQQRRRRGALRAGPARPAAGRDPRLGRPPRERHPGRVLRRPLGAVHLVAPGGLVPDRDGGGRPGGQRGGGRLHDQRALACRDGERRVPRGDRARGCPGPPAFRAGVDHRLGRAGPKRCRPLGPHGHVGQRLPRHGGHAGGPVRRGVRRAVARLPRRRLQPGVRPGLHLGGGRGDERDPDAARRPAGAVVGRDAVRDGGRPGGGGDRPRGRPARGAMGSRL
ncbi:MAG: Deacetylases, including yeast histone deacetylase and acetoin utilization protein, partial [uncultured Thermomicrobiales bacterium]